MTTHNISISIKVLTTGISIDINTESPQTTNDTIKAETLNLGDYEGLKKLLPLCDDNIITHTECVDITADEDDDNIITHTECVDITADEDDEETITTDDTENDDDEEEETDDDEEEETDDEEENLRISKISRLN